MKKFQYKVQGLYSSDMEETLAVLGGQGWELVSVVSHGEHTLKNGRKDVFLSIYLKQETN
jgi:trans-2-enoyl-CoA reductase